MVKNNRKDLKPAIFYFDVLEINISFGEIINMILNY
jgi:hypothetical protein